MTTFDPNPVDEDNGNSITENGDSNPLEEAVDGLEEIIGILMENPTLSVGLLAMGGVGVYLYKNLDDRMMSSDDSYEPIDWGKKTPDDWKYIIEKSGFDDSKELFKGDVRKLGKVYKWTTQEIPDGFEYEDLIFGDISENEIEDSETKTVYVLMTAPEETFSNMKWRVEDLYFNQNKNTTLWFINEDHIVEEQDRFKLDENIDFRREYGNIMMEKGIATANATDQMKVYQARQNILEGLPEFSKKTMFLDRNHASTIAQKQEDMDEQEILQRLLGRGKGH